ncbi:MAG: transglycosylase domain-containing protein, partial [Hyphomicrobiales bacterium]|nr:transglycosylase domain-containing protein [Hyphomicrobiales bacterium]
MSVKRNRKTPARRRRRRTAAKKSRQQYLTRRRRRQSRRTGRGRRRQGSLGLWRSLGRTAYWGTVCSIWATLVLGSVVAYHVSMLPDPWLSDLRTRPPNITILAADRTILAERGMLRGQLKLDRMPAHLINAVLATEDRRFRDHWGVDPVGLTRAMWRNYHAGAVVEGGSTITQQLAKNLFLTPERTLGRKLQEMILAVWLEIRFSKDEILELYLNRVYFGAGAYGVEGASKRYFGKSARLVSLQEAALLAGLLKAPSRYAPTRSPRRAEERASVVIANMVSAGLLAPAKAMAALAEPARVRNPSGLTGYEYAVDWVAERLPDMIADRRSDLIVETTIDARLQRKAQQVVALAMASNGGFVNAGQAAAVVLDRRGGVRAMVGGTSYKASEFNRAVKALRQPGSAFKPMVFLAALESGMTPDSVIVDEPVSINGWRPRNYDDSYAGPVTLRHALSHSINTVAVRLTMEVGRWRVIRTARRLGITTRMHDRP